MSEDTEKLFDAKLKGVSGHIMASNDIQNVVNKKIVDQLDRIEMQTSKTNDNVNLINKEISDLKLNEVSKALETYKNIEELRSKMNIIHSTCPIKPKVENLEKKYWMYTGGIIVIIFIFNLTKYLIK